MKDKKDKQEKKLVPWGEAVKLNWRALKLLYDNYPQMVLSWIFYYGWESVRPFFGIFLSARIIGELAGGRDTERLMFLVLLSLSVAAAAHLVSLFLTKWYNTYDAFWMRSRRIFSKKLLDMDYVEVEKTENEDLIYKIIQNQNASGWGLVNALAVFGQLFAALASVLGGISLTVSLFVSRVPGSAGAYTVLNNPLFVLLIIAVMLAITYLSPCLTNKAASYWAMNADVHTLANRQFGFFFGIGANKDVAADVRIYRQENICEKYGTPKTSPFGTKGMFAKLSRGPIGLYSAASAAVSVIFLGLAYLFVCLKAWAGAFGLGYVTQYVASLTQVSDGAAKLVQALGSMRNNASFLKQVFDFLDIPNNMYQGTLTVEKRNDRKYQVEFRDVSFKYPGSGAYALRHVNIKFEIGKRLAVVGMNGSGKTTFIKLLCRLYDPTEGAILLNGIDIRKYNYREYMDIFSVVFQDFELFALTLGENVASGTKYDRGRVLDCLDKAGFSDRLAEMPNGLDTYLYKGYDKDGVNVSGGEAQKIAIARSLYKDAPFIILDEPTAALDPIAEADIYSKFNDIAGDKTAIYISHRLSSCKFCDEIAVFDKGAVVQFGTHDSLSADESGKYFELWNAQAQYYNE